MQLCVRQEPEVNSHKFIVSTRCNNREYPSFVKKKDAIISDCVCKCNKGHKLNDENSLNSLPFTNRTIH